PMSSIHGDEQGALLTFAQASRQALQMIFEGRTRGEDVGALADSRPKQLGDVPILSKKRAGIGDAREELGVVRSMTARDVTCVQLELQSIADLPSLILRKNEIWRIHEPRRAQLLVVTSQGELDALVNQPLALIDEREERHKESR